MFTLIFCGNTGRSKGCRPAVYPPLAASRAMPSLQRQVSSALRAASRLAAISTEVRLPLGQYSAGTHAREDAYLAKRGWLDKEASTARNVRAVAACPQGEPRPCLEAVTQAGSLHPRTVVGSPVMMQGGARQTPMNCTTHGWRRLASSDASCSSPK